MAPESHVWPALKRSNCKAALPGTQKAIRWSGLGLGLLPLVIGAVTSLIRAGTIFFDIRLFLRGRKLVRTSPPTQGDDGSVIGTAKEAFMAMRSGQSGQTTGPLARAAPARRRIHRLIISTNTENAMAAYT